MSKFHSTVSRRTFMKGLGLAGAGLGAAAAAAPAFHDIDEVMASPKANYKQPWYVKELEFEKPSVEIDWSIMPSDWSRTRSLEPGTDSEYDMSVELRSARNKEITAIQEAGLKAGTPGYQLRDYALEEGSNLWRTVRPVTTTEGPEMTTPEERGVSRWTGTREEGTNMLRAAAHSFGCPKIGVLEITPNIRRISSASNLAKIPAECKNAIVYVVLQPVEGTKRGITKQYIGHQVGYYLGPLIQDRLQRFLKSLGYQAQALSVPSQNVAAGILSGTGELCRISHQITHEWGTVVRYTRTILTDLPLTPTPPIDAGLFRFCKTCKICAETCQEVNGQTPLSLETEPTYEVTGPWNRAGRKAFHIYWPRCSTGCPFCDGSCPFNNHGLSHIHELVLGIQATTPIFNGFFTNMEHAFGYGLHDSPQFCEEWWDRDLNALNIDMVLGSIPK